jgi:hypothetical protein
MGAGGYESWFVSARDPASPRALWIRHTRHRPQQGRESAALWCTVVDRDGDQPPVVIKEVFAAFPPDAAAGPERFRGRAAMGEQTARWDLAIAGEQLSVTTDDDDPVAMSYTDPRGGTRTVRHAALASVEVTVRRPGQGGLTLSSRRGAYEYGTREPMPGITPRPLPEG